MAPNGRHVFTSESVTEGHPDKIADQISDGILDAILAEDSHARVACETLVKTGMCIVAGVAWAFASEGLTAQGLDAVVGPDAIGRLPEIVDSLAAAISEERGTIEDVLEPYLIQQGFLMRTPRGRVATRNAWLHCGLKPPTQALPEAMELFDGD